MSTDSTIILVTGANTGIGYETVKALLRSDRKYTILLGGRDISKAGAAAKYAQDEVKSSAGSTVSPLQIDVTDDSSITAAFHTVQSKHTDIDVLINNAGASFDSNLLSKELSVREVWNRSWDTNVTGAHIVTEAFLPLLLKSWAPRLLFNTSGLSSLEDASNPKSPFYKEAPAGLPKPFSPIAYQCSKTGLNMLIVNWTRLVKDGVKVFGVAPGMSCVLS